MEKNVDFFFKKNVLCFCVQENAKQFKDVPQDLRHLASKNFPMDPNGERRPGEIKKKATLWDFQREWLPRQQKSESIAGSSTAGVEAPAGEGTPAVDAPNGSATATATAEAETFASATV